MKPKKLVKKPQQRVWKHKKPVKKYQLIIQKPKKHVRPHDSLTTELFHRSLLVFSALVIMLSHYFTKNRMIIITLGIIVLIGGTYEFVQLTRARGESLKHTLNVLSLAFAIVIGIILVVAIIFFMILIAL